MPKIKDVGKSQVTPLKHALLYKVLARQAGVLWSQNGLAKRETWIDLTAGDGVPYDGQPSDRGASPSIFMRHASYVGRDGRRTKVNVVLNELKPETFARLRDNIIRQYGEPDWLTFSNADAKVLDLSALGVTGEPEQGLFLYNDPNAITGWVLTPELMKQCPRLTCTISTLGCNVGGLKRLGREERNAWVKKIDSIEQVLAPWHEAGLFVLGDASNWAYLVTCPKKWRDEVQKDWENVLKSMGSSVQRWNPKNAASAWMKRDPKGFEVLKHKLVMTSDEFRKEHQVQQQELFSDAYQA